MSIRTQEASTLLTSYNREKKKKIIMLALLLLVTLAAGAFSLSAGSSGLTFLQSVKALFYLGDSSAVMIVRSVRLPRVLAALGAGAGLALSGCVMQNVLGNPLASPSTLGVSNSAVFGANFAIIVLGAGVYKTAQGNSLVLTSPYIVTVCAFLCAFLAAGFILFLSARRGFSPETVVLAGVAVGAFFTAGATLVQYFSDDTSVSAAVFWSFGDLGRASFSEDAVMLVVSGVSALWFMLKRRDYNAFAAGEETAKSLGVSTQTLCITSVALASLVCAVCVSFLGIIGFVGLLAPQAVKRLFGSDYRFLLPASALAGAAMLFVSDALSRSLISGVSLPVGAVTSVFGAPVFLILLIGKRRRRGE